MRKQFCSHVGFSSGLLHILFSGHSCDQICMPYFAISNSTRESVSATSILLLLLYVDTLGISVNNKKKIKYIYLQMHIYVSMINKFPLLNEI